MSKMSQYVLEQQEGEPETDFSNLRPDEIKELDEWLDEMNQRGEDDDRRQSTDTR
jgi:hypothetical protein